jgi:hypothetical protein
LNPAQSRPANCNVNNNGGVVQFPLSNNGPLEIRIKYKGGEINGSPVNIVVKPHPSSSINLDVNSAKPKKPKVNKEFSFQVNGNIDNNNLLKVLLIVEK